MLKNSLLASSIFACTPKGVEKPYFNHHPKFDIDEDSLLVAAKAVGQVVCGYFNERENINNKIKSMVCFGLPWGTYIDQCGPCFRLF